jgi:uncharacterized RDD family membrane protein YckC
VEVPVTAAAVLSDVQQDDVLIYFLAAPEDETYVKEIRTHLRPIVRSHETQIRLLDDFDAPAGSDIAAHKKQLLEADIVLSLISSDFINDDDVYDRNQSVIDRYNRGETKMISILVRNCLWKDSPLAKFQLLPTDEQPLQSWPNRDDAVVAVVTDLYESIKEILSKMSAVDVAPEATAVATGTGTPSAEPEAPTAPSEGAVEAGGVPGTPAPEAWSEPGAAHEPPAARVDAAGPATVPPAPPMVEMAAPVTPIESNWRKKYYRRVVRKRGVALFLDYLILFFLPAIVLSVLPIGPSAAGAALLIIGFVVFYLVAPAFEGSRWRATPGKRIMKLQITTKEGERISYRRAFARNVLRTLTLYSYFLVIPLIYQYVRFGKTKMLFHDEFSSTVTGERLAT